jgi:3-oxoacyl-(acyl-carrier-protein) synthase
VTGIGAISAAGGDTGALWEASAGGRAAGRSQSFEIGQASRQFAICAAPQIDVTRPELHPVRRMDRSVQLGWIAANQALGVAGLGTDRSPLTIGVMAGASRGPVSKLAEGFARVNSRRYPPTLSADCTFASLSGVLAQALDLTGPSATVSATCASGAFAIAFAAEQILLGKADAMLVGAAEAPLVPAVIAQLHAAGVVGSHTEAALTCRPFDATRNGLCLGEGSGFLVLESVQAARRRGAIPLAQLSGWGLCVDDSGRAGVSESGRGLIDSASQALTAAGLATAAIDYVNTHGTGTRLNDTVEAHALRRLFGSRADTLPCTSTKPITGHCLGATPALEAVLAIEALRRQIVPPTANCHQPDPACPINMQPLVARPARLNHVMSNSLGFWGYHASLIFSRVN